MFPYKEIIDAIRTYIANSQPLFAHNLFANITWKEGRNKLCGDWGRNNGLFQQNDIIYESYLRDCKFDGRPLASYDYDFIRSLLELIHLTHTPDPNDPYYSEPSDRNWQGDPLVTALSWLKMIYRYFPDDCKKLMQEYQGKMIPDNINVDYEVWADSILMTKKPSRMPKDKKSIIDSIKDDGSFYFLRGEKLIDDSLIWKGRLSDLTRWLRGMPIKGLDKTFKPILKKQGDDWDWKSVDGIFRKMDNKGNLSEYLTSDKLRRVGNKAH